MKIAVIGAMEEEISILRDAMVERTTKVIAGSEYTKGILEGKEVVMLKSGIGKVNAAMSTAILFEEFKPDVVINTGSAGGFNSELEVGDVIISTEVRYHDVDVTAFGFEYGQVPELPAAFEADERLRKIAVNSINEMQDIKVVEGLIVTGDSFINELDHAEEINRKFVGLQAAEMEAASIAQVAYKFDIPFIIIRSLSDIAGKESNLTFDQFLGKAAVNSAKLVTKIIKNI